MTEKTEKYVKEILETIEKYKICRFSHIFGLWTKITRAQAYNLGLDKLDSIKDAMDNNKAKASNYLLQKWITSENATLQIAAFRLVCDSEEHRLLNQQYIDHTTKNDKIESMSDEQLRSIVTAAINNGGKSE